MSMNETITVIEAVDTIHGTTQLLKREATNTYTEGNDPTVKTYSWTDYGVRGSFSSYAFGSEKSARDLFSREVAFFQSQGWLK